MPDIVGRLRSPRVTPAPGSPAQGEVYYDSSANKLYWWSGSAWVDSTGGGSAWLPVLSAQPVLDVGMTGPQIRAGRVITLADFTTNLGLNAPVGLWQMGSTGDSSGFSRNLLNKGGVTFGQGVNGNDTGGAAYFSGSGTMALYLSDTGTADPFRITAGSFGCWTKTAKQNAPQGLIGKNGAWAAATASWYLVIDSNQHPTLYASDGANWPGFASPTPVCDDRWHFIVGTLDGSVGRIYIDGVLDSFASVGAPQGVPGPLNVGSRSADAATSPSDQHFGQIAQAFVTADVLSDEQIRFLYCARIPHTLGKVPSSVALNVRRQRKGGVYVTADFPTAPQRLYNWKNQNGTDEGLAGVNMGGSGSWYPGLDGSIATSPANLFDGTSISGYYSPDSDLASGLSTRCYGCWLKTTSLVSAGVMGWGLPPASADARIVANYPNIGYVAMGSGADQIAGSTYVADGQWHFVVVVENNSALDAKRKLYVDGRLAATSNTMNSITLGGARGFRIGSNTDGSSPLAGLVDAAFVMPIGTVLGAADIAKLYAKGAQAMPPAPKDPGAHIESMNATSIYAILDSIDSQHQIDLAVA